MSEHEFDAFCDCQRCLTHLVDDLNVINAGMPASVLDDFPAEEHADEPVTLAPLASYTPEQIVKATQLIQRRAIVSAGRTYIAVASDGVTRYEADPYRQTCTCTAGQHGHRCYHLAAAIALAAA